MNSCLVDRNTIVNLPIMHMTLNWCFTRVLIDAIGFNRCFITSSFNLATLQQFFKKRQNRRYYHFNRFIWVFNVKIRKGNSESSGSANYKLPYLLTWKDCPMNVRIRFVPDDHDINGLPTFLDEVHIPTDSYKG